MASNTILENPNAKDYNKYDFSGYELTPNDKEGYDWTDNSGAKHSIYTDDNGINHSITGTDGTSNNYTYNGTKYNDYINKLNKGAKKAYKAQSKTGITQQATQNLSNTTAPTSKSQVIVMTDENGNSRKVGTTTDPNAQQLLTGKSIANSFEAIANANVGDFWIDKDNNIHVVTDRDITYCKGMLNKNGDGNGDSNYSSEKQENTESQPRTTTPEENNGDENKKGSKERIEEEVENTRKLLHDPDNYKDNYQAIIDTAGKRGIAEDTLSGSEGKEKGIYGPTYALINGDFGNYHLPKHETTKRYKLRDSITGEVIDDGQGATANELKKLNETIAQNRKEKGWTIVESGPVYKVYDPESKEVLRSFSSEDAAIKFRNSKGDKNNLLISEDGEPGYEVIDRKGNVIEHFDNEKDAKKYLNGWFELSDDVASESHYVSYNDKKTRYDTKEEAEQARKELSKATRGDRAKAWAQYLTHLGSGLGKGALDFLANAASWATSGQLVGDKFTGPSTWDKELNKRVEGNNELYYKNEEARNDVVRKLMSMADSGMIDLNNLTNEQMATFIGTIGKENASQIINTIRKQELDKFMALDYWKNWDEDQKNALSAWFAQSGQGPQTESMIALASGKVKPKDYANKWNAETRLALAQQGLDLQRIEKAIEDATLKNKMTRAQADVIKELVGEQLKAAKLGNNAKAVEIATSSVDSLSKIIDAVVPF